MSRVFLIADLHLGHPKVAQMRGFNSADEHDAALVEKWNSKVGKRDTVWVLGDVAMFPSALVKLRLMRGTLKLVGGNHDEHSLSHYVQYFAAIHGAIEVRKMLLTHIPVHPNQFHRYKANIHGHLHSRRVQRDIGEGSVDDHRYLCVSAEQTGLEPLLFEDAERRLVAQLEEHLARESL